MEPKTLEAFLTLTYIFLPCILGYLHTFIKGDKVAANVFLGYYIFIAVGLQGLLTGYWQIAKPEFVVDYVQWPYSPFLLELGMANIAFGVLGIFSLWRGQGWQAAAATGYGLFLFLTGIGHLLDILHHGPTPGSAGSFLFGDLLVPLILFLLGVLA